MITNLTRYVRRLAKVTALVIKYPTHFRHLIYALARSQGSWLVVLGYNARGSAGTPRRINKALGKAGHHFRFRQFKLRLVGKKQFCITNGPDDLLDNYQVIHEAYLETLPQDKWVGFWEMILTQSLMFHLSEDPFYANLFKGKKNAETELAALASGASQLVIELHSEKVRNLLPGS
jgi:hypothetical protein